MVSPLSHVTVAVSEIIVFAEEVGRNLGCNGVSMPVPDHYRQTLNDINAWSPESVSCIIIQGTINCVRALGGYTYSNTLDTVFDNDIFIEKNYREATSGASPLALNWYL